MSDCGSGMKRLLPVEFLPGPEVEEELEVVEETRESKSGMREMLGSDKMIGCCHGDRS